MQQPLQRCACIFDCDCVACSADSVRSLVVLSTQLFCSLSSWFMFYASTRTLSNSLEMSLTLVALYLWPDTCAFPLPDVTNSRDLPGWLSRRRSALILAAITFVIRPTSALLWVVLGIVHVISLPSWSQRAGLIFRDVLPIGAVTLLLSVALDTAFYNRHILFPRDSNGVISLAALDWSALWSSLRIPLVSLNFLRINSGTDLAALYGTHPWHWYLTEGLPTNLGPLTPCFLVAVVQFVRGNLKNRSDRTPRLEAGVVLPSQSRRALWILLSLLCFSVAMYSCNAHKEPRFLMPVTPIAFLMVGVWMARWEEQEEELEANEGKDTATEVATQSAEAMTTGGIRRRKPETTSSPALLVPSASTAAAVPRGSSRKLFRPLLAFLLVSNAALTSYFTFLHQSGPARVFATLSQLESEWRSQRCVGIGGSPPSTCHANQQFSVHFLMSCHSMPLYSWMHRAPLADGRRSVQMHFLDCSPLFINGRLQGHGANECSASRQFNEHPAKFVEQYYTPPEPSLQHIRRSIARDRSWRTDCEWSWYHSSAYFDCLSSRMGINETQALAIDNELPGGGFTPTDPSSPLRCSLPPEPLLPNVLVLPSEKLEETLASWLARRWYTLKASLFHSHLEDTKQYLVFQRGDDEGAEPEQDE